MSAQRWIVREYAYARGSALPMEASVRTVEGRLTDLRFGRPLEWRPSQAADAPKGSLDGYAGGGGSW